MTADITTTTNDRSAVAVEEIAQTLVRARAEFVDGVLCRLWEQHVGDASAALVAVVTVLLEVSRVHGSEPTDLGQGADL